MGWLAGPRSRHGSEVLACTDGNVIRVSIGDICLEGLRIVRDDKLPQLRMAIKLIFIVPFVAHIETQDDYERALELMDQLVDGYDANKPLI